VIELLTQVAAERGLDFEPPPTLVTDALPELTCTIDALAEGCNDA